MMDFTYLTLVLIHYKDISTISPFFLKNFRVPMDVLPEQGSLLLMPKSMAQFGLNFRFA